MPGALAGEDAGRNRGPCGSRYTPISASTVESSPAGVSAMSASRAANAVGRDGQPTQGGYSQKIVVDEAFAVRIPQAIPLPTPRR
jgi:hypothetical protein